MSTNIEDVIVREETKGKETGGHFGASTVSFDAQANTSTTHEVSPDIPIALLSAKMHVKGVGDGDSVEFLIAPDTLVGTLDVEAGSGVSTVTVPQSVIDLFNNGDLFVGQDISLKDGANPAENLGAITAFSDDNNTVTFQGTTSTTFPVGSEILITTRMTPKVFGDGKIELCGSDHLLYVFGEDKIGGSRIDPTQKIRMIYTETKGNTPNIKVQLSFLY